MSSTQNETQASPPSGTSTATPASHANDVPRHVMGLHRSDLARVQDVVRISRLEAAESVTQVMNNLAPEVASLGARLDTATQAFKILNESLAVVEAAIADLERRTWRGRWRRFTHWCDAQMARLRALLPQPITEEEYADAVLPTFGHGPEGDGVWNKTLPLVQDGKLIGQYVEYTNGHTTFLPDKDVMRSLCSTDTEYVKWVERLDRVSKEILANV